MVLNQVCSTDGMIYRYNPTQHTVYYVKGKKTQQERKIHVDDYKRIDNAKTYRDHLMNFYAKRLEYTTMSKPKEKKMLSEMQTGDYV